jgi:hypothetical protein
MPPDELIWNARALDDLARLDQQVARRVIAAAERYCATRSGNVCRLTGHEMYRLRVGDWRVRFVQRSELRPALPPGTEPVTIRVIEVLRVRHRSVAYDDL